MAKCVGVSGRDKDGNEVPSAAQVYVKVHFQYSKVRPLKEKIHWLLETQRKLQRDITNASLRMPLQNAWSFPAGLSEGGEGGEGGGGIDGAGEAKQPDDGGGDEWSGGGFGGGGGGGDGPVGSDDEYDGQG